MRNLIPILLAVVVLSSGCDNDGYSCTSEGCYAENNAQYLTLEDCLSVCDTLDPDPTDPDPIVVFESCGDLISHQGYNYSTVQIDDLCWFSENCRYLPEVAPSSIGSNSDPYYYVYGFEDSNLVAAKASANYDTYGVLYNWPAVMTGDICPIGWRVPSHSDFESLDNLLAGEYGADPLQSTSGWIDVFGNSNNGTNSSGFNGLPGGRRDDPGFYSLGQRGNWWSTSENPNDIFGNMSYLFSLYEDIEDSITVFDDLSEFKAYGYSCRCVRE